MRCSCVQTRRMHNHLRRRHVSPCPQRLLLFHTAGRSWQHRCPDHKWQRHGMHGACDCARIVWFCWWICRLWHFQRLLGRQWKCHRAVCSSLLCVCEYDDCSRLFMNENKMTTLPTEITFLTGLTSLEYDERMSNCPMNLFEAFRITQWRRFPLKSAWWLLCIFCDWFQPFIFTNALICLMILNKNSLTEIPTEIGLLTSLTALWINYICFTLCWNQSFILFWYLTQNLVSEIPTELCQLTSLEALRFVSISFPPN